MRADSRHQKGPAGPEKERGWKPEGKGPDILASIALCSGLPARLQSQRPAYTGLQEPGMDSAVSVASEGSGLRLPFWDAAPIGPRFRLWMMRPHIPGSGTGVE